MALKSRTQHYFQAVEVYLEMDNSRDPYGGETFNFRAGSEKVELLSQ
jgi:hypothetical protein